MAPVICTAGPTGTQAMDCGPDGHPSFKTTKIMKNHERFETAGIKNIHPFNLSYLNIAWPAHTDRTGDSIQLSSNTYPPRDVTSTGQLGAPGEGAGDAPCSLRQKEAHRLTDREIEKIKLYRKYHTSILHQEK